MKDIKFSLIEEEIKEWVLDPKPAIECIPEWYKHIPASYERLSMQKGGWKTPTIKKCVPFLDSMTAGYMILLSSDVYVHENDGALNFDWGISERYMVVAHVADQVRGVPMEGFSQYPVKWINFHHIKTPKGYSSLIVHPLNRPELPFHTLSGVVDTDSHPIAINFPFLMKSGFHGIIERGTPIAQVIPFKRDSWKMQMGEPLKNHSEKLNLMTAKLFNSYKSRFWQKKHYR